ncbi:hypothetical protein N9L76_04430 [bacterium]|nr:hypothetical protein [bacterium]
MPTTATGVKLSTGGETPFPNPPMLPCPQHTIVMFVRSAHERCTPTLMLAAVVMPCT